MPLEFREKVKKKNKEHLRKHTHAARHCNNRRSALSVYKVQKGNTKFTYPFFGIFIKKPLTHVAILRLDTVYWFYKECEFL